MNYIDVLQFVRKFFSYTSLLFLVLSSFILFWWTITPFYYSLIMGAGGTFLVAIAILFYVISMLFFMIAYKGKRIVRFLPLIAFVVSILLFFIPSPNFDLDLWFTLNKEKFERIDNLLNENPKIENMSDLKRHFKNINNCTAEGDFIITEEKEILKYFEEVIEKDTLDINAISEIRNLIDDLHIISIENYKEYTIYVIDGFIDNEYGIIKFKEKKHILKVGERIKFFRLLTSIRKISGSFYYWVCT